MVTQSAQLLLILISREPQSAVQLIEASNTSPAETLRQLQRLIDQGFIIAADTTALTVYRLTPKSVQGEGLNLQERILLVEDDLALQNLMVEVLENEGYAVIATVLPMDAVAILTHVAFDLVITDGFGGVPAAVFASTRAILEEAGATPVALFTAHRVTLEEAQLAGFHTVFAKPFDLTPVLQHIRMLLAR